MRISDHMASGVTPFPSGAGISPAISPSACAERRCRPFLRQNERDAGATKCRKAEYKLW
jgi:hypothetical protein